MLIPVDLPASGRPAAVTLDPRFPGQNATGSKGTLAGTMAPPDWPRPTDSPVCPRLAKPLRNGDRVDEFRDSLGTARGVLSSRRHKLVDQGILSRRQYWEHPPRYEYTLTEKGRALAPVITALMTWGDTWAPGPSGPPVVLIHEPCGHAMHPVQTCPHCHGEVAGNVRSVPGPGAAPKETPPPPAPVKTGGRSSLTGDGRQSIGAGCPAR
jgi:DNA-binding HxlR family transcriptional regulator